MAASVFIIKESTGEHPTQHNHPKCLTSNCTKNCGKNLSTTTPFQAVVRHSQNSNNCQKKSRRNQPPRITSPASTVTNNERPNFTRRRPYPNPQMAIQSNTESSTMSRIVFNEPYESEGLEPQQIRDDFADLTLISDPEVLLRSLSSFLPTSTLAEFIDDHMMGRI